MNVRLDRQGCFDWQGCFDRQGWITVFAALLLGLITLLTSYSHVDLLGAASVDLPQQAGIPCIAAAVATAIEQ